MKPTGGTVLDYWNAPLTITLPVSIWANVGKYVQYCHDHLEIKCNDEDMCVSLHAAGCAINTAFVDLAFDSEKPAIVTKKRRGRKS